MKNTFYKRPLPCPPAVPFSSPEGEVLLLETLQQGTARVFYKLIEQFHTQDEPSYCGLASLAMVLNALSLDPRRAWKGPWRWFHEEMLDCCKPLADVQKEGVTLAQVACLARCNGAEAVAIYHCNTSLDAFRHQVLEVCSQVNVVNHMIVSYSRRTFKQTGDGHFSPIGGYHRGRDLVLILDVARFKYPPHWVPLPLLYEAMANLDPTTSLPRGYLLLSLPPSGTLGSILFSLDVSRGSSWHEAEQYATRGMLDQVSSGSTIPADPNEALQLVVAHCPLVSLSQFIVARYSMMTPEEPEGREKPGLRKTDKESQEANCTGEVNGGGDGHRSCCGPPLRSRIQQGEGPRDTALQSLSQDTPPSSYALGCCCRNHPLEKAKAQLIMEIRHLGVYPLVNQYLNDLDAGGGGGCKTQVDMWTQEEVPRCVPAGPHEDVQGHLLLPERLCLLLTLQDPAVWRGCLQEGYPHIMDVPTAAWKSLLTPLPRGSLLEAEVGYLRQQFQQVTCMEW